jgi:hypothetical protein
MLQRRELEICNADFTVTAARTSVADFTAPFCNERQEKKKS